MPHSMGGATIFQKKLGWCRRHESACIRDGLCTPAVRSSLGISEFETAKVGDTYPASVPHVKKHWPNYIVGWVICMNGKLDKPQGFWAWPPRNCWKCPDFSMLDINVKQVTWPVLRYQMVSASLQVVGLQNDERPSNLVFVTVSDFWLFQMAWLPMGCSKYFCTSISRSPIPPELRSLSSWGCDHRPGNMGQRVLNLKGIPFHPHPGRKCTSSDKALT